MVQSSLICTSQESQLRCQGARIFRGMFSLLDIDRADPLKCIRVIPSDTPSCVLVLLYILPCLSSGSKLLGVFSLHAPRAMGASSRLSSSYTYTTLLLSSWLWVRTRTSRFEQIRYRASYKDVLIFQAKWALEMPEEILLTHFHRIKSIFLLKRTKSMSQQNVILTS